MVTKAHAKRNGPLRGCRPTRNGLIVVVLLWLLVCVNAAVAQDQPKFEQTQMLTNREAAMTFRGQAGQLFRLEASSDLRDWVGLATVVGAASVAWTDSAAPYFS